MSYRNYYDTSSYGRSRDIGNRPSSYVSDRPASVTAKYLNPTPYKTSSIPIISRDRSSTREEQSPIAAIANKYSSYSKINKEEKPASKYERKDLNKLSVPSVISSRSRDASPASSSHNKYAPRLSKVSPDRTNKPLSKSRSPDPASHRDKDIPNKTDKPIGYCNSSSYKIYPRTSYTRPTSRTEQKPDITVSRYGISNRISTNYLRSPTIDKTRSSISPVSHNEVSKNEPRVQNIQDSNSKSDHINKDSGADDHTKQESISETISVTTRHTSPTPPGSSAYVRSRRADMAKTVEKTITRPSTKPEMVDKETQSDRLDDPTRNSRFASTARSSVSSYTGYTPSSNNYTGYAGRYSTQYSNLRENNSLGINYDRSSRSHSKEPCLNDIPYIDSNETRETDSNISLTRGPEPNQDVVTAVYKQNEDDEDGTSQIIINVNLKLKKTKSPHSVSSTEIVSPEITITNSQLPPQSPKTEGSPKIKKIKTRKTSTDSSSDSSSKIKKVIKKKSKSSSSSAESDIGSDGNNDEKSKSKNSKKSRSNSASVPSKPIKSRESKSNSPESSTTLSTQSSVSEDDTTSKSKTNEISRTSADEMSIPTDKSEKQLNSNGSKNEGAEEAKSFLIRALAPVTNLFKTKNQDNVDSKWIQSTSSESTGKDVSNILTESDGITKSKTNTDDIVASNNDNLVQLKAIRHIESGERAWWLESDSSKKSSEERQKSGSERNLPRKITHIESGERAWWLNECNEDKNEVSTNTHSDKVPRINKYNDDSDKPWWLDSNANVPDGVECLSSSRKSSSESEKNEKFDFFKVRHISSGEQKDWWLTSSEKSLSNNNRQETQSKSSSDNRNAPLQSIRHIESGERPWWQTNSGQVPEGVEKLPTPPNQTDSESSDSEEVHVYATKTCIPPFPVNLQDDEPLGDRRSPEGLETPRITENCNGRESPYENSRRYSDRAMINAPRKYISRYMDIDDILGTSSQIYSPFMDSILAKRTGLAFDEDMLECEEIDSTQVKIHDSTAQRPVIKKLRTRGEIIDCRDEDQLDDAALQVFKDGKYGSYLDLDLSLAEQEEELEGLQDSRKNAIVLRTQLSVRVHSLIERLLQSEGRELRRALFSLKQVLQSDDDLVHEFVANKGLDCLMQLGNSADHNYLDYILRALGQCYFSMPSLKNSNLQILLYVDGMHGVMAHKRCIQWLYSLVASKFRHVVKTALKLLLVFVEYTDENCLLLIDAIAIVDNANGRQPWHNVMKILKDFDASDTELLIYATNLINKCLNNIMDRNLYYDHVDSLHDQGMDDIIQLYMAKQGTDLDLLRQLQIFEAVLIYEDGDETGTALKQLDDSVINAVRRRSINNMNIAERRKSKKFYTKDKEISHSSISNPETKNNNNDHNGNISTLVQDIRDKELTCVIRRRKERYTRQAHHITPQQELLNNTNSINNEIISNTTSNKPITCNGNSGIVNNIGIHTNYPQVNDEIEKVTSHDGHCDLKENHKITNGCHNQDTVVNNLCLSGLNYQKMSFHNNRWRENDKTYKNSSKCLKPSEMLLNGNQRYTSGLKQRIQNGTLGHTMNGLDALSVLRQKQQECGVDTRDDRGIVLNKEHSIRDLAQKLTSPTSPSFEEKPSRVSDMAGIVSKAKEELAKSQSKEIVKSPTIEKPSKIHEVKVSENDLHWEELRKGCLYREFHLCDLDFSDLRNDSDEDITSNVFPSGGAPPPPPPPSMFAPVGRPGAPPPPPVPFPPFSRHSQPAQPPRALLSSERSNDSDSCSIKKNKKTVKLFWKEIQENPVPIALRSKIGGFIWDDLPEIKLDTKMLEHLFESRTNDLIIKEKIAEPKRNLILDAKRSNAINIAMKKLPTPQTIKAAILKMDATVIGREGIEKLLTMLPTEDEKVKIQEAQYANPDLPLGSAEQFLLTLASISELSSRLKLWVFKLDFDNLEREVAEPLMDLKHGIELLKINKTFKAILATLRSVGSFLNGSSVKGFRLDYLSKVMEVKDTVHKHPLLYHICEMIIVKFPDSTDFFSEVGPVIRASKVDFDMLSANLSKLESDCKASWDHMKKVAKHDGSQIFKTKINEFLTDAAERIILLSIIKKRVMNRYSKFLLYLGVPLAEVDKTKPSEFLKVIAEFALEYRTSRERVLLQLEKKANHRERNKTRGKMIIDVGNYSNKSGDSSADTALKQLLKSDPYADSRSDVRRKLSQPSPVNTTVNGDLSTEDEIIESLVRSATSKRQPLQRDRKRNSRLSSDKKKSFHKRTLSPQRQQSAINSYGSGIQQRYT